MQINFELEKGSTKTLREVLMFPEAVIQFFVKEHARGRRVIIESKDFLQLVYRIQFRRIYAEDYSMFRYNVKWTICHSPIELPVSDSALVPLGMDAHKATFYVLPISPKLLLKGQMNWGKQQASDQCLMRTDTLSGEEAEYWFDAICASAITELISAQRISDVSSARARAKTKGIRFLKIVSPEAAISAGAKDMTTHFGLRVVSCEEYVKFIHTFIQPGDN